MTGILISLVGLLLVLTAGWMAVRRALGLSELLAAVSLTPAVGTSFFLLGANAAIPWLGFEKGAAFGVASSLLLALVLVRLGGPCPPLRSGLTRSAWLLFAMAALVTAAYALTWQSLNPDYDFWNDFPQQGLLQRGLIPPPNPYLPELTMHGHYGRNLAVALISAMSGTHLVATQHVLVTLWQVLTLGLVFCCLRAWGATNLASGWASALAWLGVAVGGWFGILDSFYHHGALAHHLLFASVLALGCVWRRPGWGSGLCAGMVFGALALTFETYLGLLALGAMGVLVLARLWRGRSPSDEESLPTSAVPLPWIGLALGVGLLLASTQGGPLTDMASRLWAGERAPESAGVLNQSQRVTLQIPKTPFLHLLLQPWDYWRVSAALSSPPLGLGAPESGRTFHAGLWSWEVLRMHWIPTWVAPLTLALLLHHRSLAGLFWWFFGVAAFLIPGVVGFGPVHEAEYYRWEWAAGIGFSIGLGVALATARTRVAQVSAWGLVLLILLPGVTSMLKQLQAPVSPGFPGIALDGRRWLLHFGERFGIREVDMDAAAWLARVSRPGDRFAADYRIPHPFAVTSEGILVGLSGVAATGHAFPAPQDFVGTPPFRRSALARAFWAHPDPAGLEALGADWLYLRGEVPPGLETLPGVSLARQFGGGGQETRRIYRVLRRTVSARAASSPPTRLEVAGLQLPEKPRLGEVEPATLTLGTDLPDGSVLEFRFVSAEPRTGHDPEPGPMAFTLAGAGPTHRLHLALPFHAGRYRVQVQVMGEDRVLAGTLEEPILLGVYLPSGRALPPLVVTQILLPSTADPGTEVQARVRLQPAADAQGWSRLARGMLVARDPMTGRYLWPERFNLQDVEIRPGQELTVPVRVPARSGTYRFDLYLVTPDGHSQLLLGRSLRLGPPGTGLQVIQAPAR